MLNNALWEVFRWLPGLLLRRFFSANWLAAHFEIDIRPRNSPVEIVYQPKSENSVRIYLSVRNETHFEVEVDRITLKFFYGAEMTDLTHLRRELLAPREKREIYLTAPIETTRAATLPFQYKHNSSHCELHVLAECNSKLHKFRIETRLEGIRPAITNEDQLRRTSEEGTT